MNDNYIVKKMLRILVRQDSLTSEQYYELNELMITLLKPKLRDFTLDTLGHLQIVFNNGHIRSIQASYPIVEGAERFGLDRKGIFTEAPCHPNSVALQQWKYAEGTTGPAIGATYKFWMLTRDAEWYTVEVQSEIEHNERTGKPGHFDKDEKVRKVIILPSTMVEACEFRQQHPNKIWERLGQVLNMHTLRRKGLLKEAARLEKQYNTVNDVMVAVQDV